MAVGQISDIFIRCELIINTKTEKSVVYPLLNFSNVKLYKMLYYIIEHGNVFELNGK